MWAGRRAYERATLLYWQRRCADFSMPAGTVAYDENPATTPALWANVSAGYNYFQFIDRSTGQADPGADTSARAVGEVDPPTHRRLEPARLGVPARPPR